MSLIYHITARADWDAAQIQGAYTAPSLHTEGFIHCSTAVQVVKVANAFYRDVPDCILLCIETHQLTAPMKWEAPNHPDPNNPPATVPQELFPHIYGAINLTAVVQVVNLPQTADGLYELPEGLSH